MVWIVTNKKSNYKKHTKNLTCLAGFARIINIICLHFLKEAVHHAKKNCNNRLDTLWLVIDHFDIKSYASYRHLIYYYYYYYFHRIMKNINLLILMTRFYNSWLKLCEWMYLCYWFTTISSTTILSGFSEIKN